MLSAHPPARHTARSVSKRVLIDRLQEEILALEAAASGNVPPKPSVRPIRPVGVDVGREIAFLRHVADGIEHVEGEHLPYDCASAGTVLLVRDLRSGRDWFRKLMPGPTDPRDAAQVHVGSAVGRALLGGSVGETVTLEAPGGERKLKIKLMTTLPQRLGLHPR